MFLFLLSKIVRYPEKSGIIPIMSVIQKPLLEHSLFAICVITLHLKFAFVSLHYNAFIMILGSRFLIITAVPLTLLMNGEI